jgi:hypothetical protein
MVLTVYLKIYIFFLDLKFLSQIIKVFFLFSGVVHHDDQMYLFFTSALFPLFKPEDPETRIVERQTKMWANFVQTG